MAISKQYQTLLTSLTLATFGLTVAYMTGVMIIALQTRAPRDTNLRRFDCQSGILM